MSDPQLRTRRRPLTGGSLQSQSKTSNNAPVMDLKTALSSAKEKFEADLAIIEPLSTTANRDRRDKRKTASAPASPGKALSVMLPTYESAKRPRLSNSPKNLRKSSLLMPANEVLQEDNLTAASEVKEDEEDHISRLFLNDPTKKHVKKGNKGVSMSEVIKLHQDEGVINLLHALPASRRRPSSSYVATSQSSNSSNSVRRRPSNEVERGQAAKGLSQASASSESSLNAVWQRRHINPANLLRRSVIDPQTVRPCTQEELMKSVSSLDILKQLPDKEYAKLWSSPAR